MYIYMYIYIIYIYLKVAKSMCKFKNVSQICHNLTMCILNMCLALRYKSITMLRKESQSYKSISELHLQFLVEIYIQSRLKS